MPADEVEIFLAEQAPALKNFSFGHNFAVVERTLTVQIFCVVHELLLIIGQGIAFYITIYMYYAIKKLKTSMSTSTHQLQKLLHLSIVIEASIIGITITVPLSFVGIMIIFPIPYEG
jgi:hypothetical protein